MLKTKLKIEKYIEMNRCHCIATTSKNQTHPQAFTGMKLNINKKHLGMLMGQIF